MKGTGVAWILLLFLLSVAAGCATAPDPQVPHPAAGIPQHVRSHYIIGVDGDYPPFTVKDREGNFSGFDIEAARLVAEQEGFDVTFVSVPWDQIVPALENGTIDSIWSGMTVTDERQARMNFSEPYYTVNQSIAVRAGSGVTLQDLYAGRVRIGVQAGSSEAEWVKGNLIGPGAMPAANLSLSPDITTLTETLRNGTVDATIIQFPSQQQAVAGQPLVILGSTPSRDRYAVAVRKTDPALLATLDDGLGQLRADPRWQQLLQKYGLDY